MYENSCWNIFVICITFSVYYLALIILFWGCVSLGAADPVALMGVNISIFLLTLIIIGILLISGHKSNRKQELHDFY